MDRVLLAGLTKKDLLRGRWRYLTDKEIHSQHDILEIQGSLPIFFEFLKYPNHRILWRPQCSKIYKYLWRFLLFTIPSSSKNFLLKEISFTRANR